MHGPARILLGTELVVHQVLILLTDYGVEGKLLGKIPILRKNIKRLPVKYMLYFDIVLLSSFASTALLPSLSRYVKRDWIKILSVAAASTSAVLLPRMDTDPSPTNTFE